MIILAEQASARLLSQCFGVTPDTTLNIRLDWVSDPAGGQAIAARPWIVVQHGRSVLVAAEIVQQQDERLVATALSQMSLPPPSAPGARRSLPYPVSALDSQPLEAGLVAAALDRECRQQLETDHGDKRRQPLGIWVQFDRPAQVHDRNTAPQARIKRAGRMIASVECSIGTDPESVPSARAVAKLASADSPGDWPEAEGGLRRTGL